MGGGHPQSYLNMAIFYTTGELKHRTFPETYVGFDQLESLCGADVLCSPLNIPCKNERMLVSHIKAGAFLVQIKDGSDLPASFDDGRLLEFVTRSSDFAIKHNICMKAYQRIVLPIGVYIGYEDDSLKINNRPAFMSYKRFLGATSRAGERGLFVEPFLTNSSFLYWYLDSKERHAIEIKERPVEQYTQMSPEMYEAANSPLQQVVKVKDGRRLLRALGLSEVDTDAIWEVAQHNTVQALRLVTDPRFAKSKDNTTRIKSGKIKTYRERMGMAEGELL